MTAFTFSIEQLRSAPPEVRRWLAGEIARALGAVGVPQPSPGGANEADPMVLAACTRADAVRVFELIGSDAVVTPASGRFDAAQRAAGQRLRRASSAT